MPGLSLILTPRVSFKTTHTTHVVTISAMSFTAKNIVRETDALFILFVGQSVEERAVTALGNKYFVNACLIVIYASAVWLVHSFIRINMNNIHAY